MSFCGYAIYLYKSRYGYPEKQQENKLHNPNPNQDNDFIKEIYSVKSETGNIDYLRCDCKNFPDYKPIGSQKQLQIDSEGIIHSSK